MSNNDLERQFSKGWVNSSPLTNYSSLNEMSLLGFIGLNPSWSLARFFIEFNFNLETPVQIHPRAFLSFHTQDADKPPGAADCCYSITNLKRWRIDISSFTSFDDYLNSLIRWHRCNYVKAGKQFHKFNCKVEYIDGDWSQYAEIVYQLYLNVAIRHKDKLYNRNFFQEIAKRNDYKLFCAFKDDTQLIGLFVLQEEGQTLHSICCGFDYEYSSKCYTYSWLHYELIRLAIEAKKYNRVDVGLTADDSKKLIGFMPINARMDIYTNNKLAYHVLKTASSLLSATITPEAKLKFRVGKRLPS